MFREYEENCFFVKRFKFKLSTSERDEVKENAMLAFEII